MAGLKKFVNNLIQKHNYGKLIGTVAQIEDRVDDAEADITSLKTATAKLAIDTTSLKTAKANIYIVDTAANIGATTRKIGEIELIPGDFVLDTETPKLWIVIDNGTNVNIAFL